MKGGKRPQGYTIVEVMIFLAVTTGLFIAVAATFSGRQAEAEFSTASRDMESRLQDIINDVSTGYYSNPGTFTCVKSGSEPSFGTTDTQQGKNNECIFVGRVTQFDLNTSRRAYNVYTAAGLRQILDGASNRDVDDLTEANPRLIAIPDYVDDTIVDKQQIPHGLEFVNMFYHNGVNWAPIQAVGFFSTFAKYDSQGLKPGTISVNVLPIAAGGNTQAHVVNAVRTSVSDASAKNPANGIIICFNGDTTNKYSELKIGGGGRDLSTNLEIKSGRCPATR